MNDLEKSPDFLAYYSEDGTISIRVIADNDTVWITEKSMAEIFKVEPKVISGFINTIFEENELKKSNVFSKQKHQKDLYKKGVETFELYNLDMIIAVGYRINPHEATRFRLWAENFFNKSINFSEVRKGGFWNASGPINSKEKLPIKKDEDVTGKLDSFSKQLKGLLSVPPPKKNK